MAISKALLLSLALSALVSAAQADTAQQIVASADKVRNPDKPFRSTATLVAYNSGRPVDKNVFTVFSKVDAATGQFRDLVIYVDPPRDAGKTMLFAGQYLWFYDPASKDSVRISPQQQLVGQAAAGDVLTVNFAVDYAASLIGTETIADAGGKNRTCSHIDLKPAKASAIYNRIEYWVEQGTDFPVKAKFYSDSGQLLKILYYRGQKTRNSPEQAVILDAVNPALVTTVDFSEAKFQDIPDSWFQRDYLPHLKPN